MLSTNSNGKESQPSTECSQACRKFEFPEILLATANFDESLVIGKGGFGKVYKGNIINGKSLVVAAIKRLDSMSTQGATEFWAEVEMLSKLRHCHLVSLFGYCNHEKEKILIYEYMPNGTLEDHLHKLGTPLSWLQRLKICISAARGLDYLHTGTGIDVGVIHRDIKSSNILLHESWAAKISDFGLSRIGPTNQPSTYVNTLVKGTFGYLDPNYFTTGRLTRKSDVYAFGVVLLEVLCRKRAVDRSLDEEQWGLVTWAQGSIKEGSLKNIVDSEIRGQISTKCLKEFSRIVERCLLSNPKQRPTMAEVVVSLDSLMILQEKTNTSSQGVGKTICGKMFDMFPSTLDGENSVPGDSKVSDNYKAKNRLAGDTLGSNNIDCTSAIPSLKVFKFSDLKKATRNFSQDLCMDDFGEVFLGWIDKKTFAPSTQSTGFAVAVKRSKDLQQWQNVVTVLGLLAHSNIVSLLGYCDDKEHKYFLVYEYVQNQKLSNFLFRGVVQQLSWGTRLMIMIGVANGLAYMHMSKHQVIHGFLKSCSILIDQDFNAKLGSFEMARFCNDIGNIDGELSMKTDIYSFGVILLEILTGQRALDSKRPPYQFDLVKWTTPFLADRRELKKIIDPRLEQNYPLERAFECAALALRCLAKDPKDRPTSEEVLWGLEQIYVVNK
ncbi:receptor-like protein kinase FERONIA isoform X1 [Lactuca sativa]|uniref:Protein kinase domain-containing protein n=1 Tax=Lactuca sativa TaxID=4236 RepID=A0A9R1X2Z3_LACSA|nr:receptor-like protein kinase FERONIA isoform X1 [Lactuca sativa]KAJ0196174.1 hypothetical protein LSAT_V11C700367270 [Lactuca sativa]